MQPLVANFYHKIGSGYGVADLYGKKKYSYQGGRVELQPQSLSIRQCKTID